MALSRWAQIVWKRLATSCVSPLTSVHHSILWLYWPFADFGERDEEKKVETVRVRPDKPRETALIVSIVLHKIPKYSTGRADPVYLQRQIKSTADHFDFYELHFISFYDSIASELAANQRVFPFISPPKKFKQNFLSGSFIRSKGQLWPLQLIIVRSDN